MNEMKATRNQIRSEILYEKRCYILTTDNVSSDRNINTKNVQIISQTVILSNPAFFRMSEPFCVLNEQFSIDYL